MAIINSNFLQISTPAEIAATMLFNLSQSLGEDIVLELLPELSLMYLESAPQLLTEMRQAIALGDTRKLREAAHTLKGSSGSMGLTMFATLCQEVESSAKEGALEKAVVQLSYSEIEYKKVESVLKEYAT
jgi:HPt (histidine-containing phosphotransfer) domain-containing protein